jgi:hypothetical protein
MLACFARIAAGQSPPAEVQNISVAPKVTIDFVNGPSVRNRGGKGHFRLTAVRPNESVLVRLDYLPTFAGLPIAATPLDGGSVALANSNLAVDQNGVGWVRFNAGPKPGLYRVMILTGGVKSILKFWVDDPLNPAGNPPAIRRGTQS